MKKRTDIILVRFFRLYLSYTVYTINIVQSTFLLIVLFGVQKLFAMSFHYTSFQKNPIFAKYDIKKIIYFKNQVQWNDSSVSNDFYELFCQRTCPAEPFGFGIGIIFFFVFFFQERI
jgi:hypothetical protein